MAVFQYGWRLQSYSRDLVIGLAKNGYRVDFFIDRRSVDTGFIDMSTLLHPQVAVHTLPGKRPRSRLMPIRVVSRIWRRLQFMFGSIYWLIPRRDVEITKQRIASDRKTYSAIIGIEKNGLVFAGVVAKSFKIPVIYYSLELYFSDFSTDYYFQGLLDIEKYYHDKSVATIVQDSLRADALYHNNGIGNQPRIYFPVSALSTKRCSKTSYWHDRLGLSAEKRVILYFGMLDIPSRELSEIVTLWTAFDRDLVLVLHGFGNPSNLKTIVEELNAPNVYISTDLVTEDEVPKLIAAADVGVCIYGNKTINNRLTAFSSLKIAQFLREGVPIVSSDNESYERLYSEFMCGESISSFGDLSSALRKILAHHDEYVKESRLAFDEIYSFEKNFQSLVQSIGSLLEDRPQARDG